MEIEYLKPTLEMVEYIAQNMRQSDKEEVWASDHFTPLQALTSGWEASDFSVIVAVNGEPCAMVGLVKRGILTKSGVPWMLATEDSLKYKKRFLIDGVKITDTMLTICSRLQNFVHCKNTVSIQWLKRIGFKLDDPEPYGKDKELFHKFYIERI